jgi:hypothetical protein
VALCFAAVIIPAVPGVGAFGSGETHRSASTDAGSQTFLSAPACSADADDLCLDPARQASATSYALQEERKALQGELRFEPAATAAPEPQPAPQPAPEPTEAPVVWASMEVREGDSLTSLAAWFGVSPFDLAVVNGIGVDDWLYTGTTLTIPIPESDFVTPPTPDLVLDLAGPAPTAAPPYHPPAGIVVPPAPTPPPATPPPSSGNWTKDDAVAAICSLPWDCTRMVAIAGCESGLRANAYNPVGYYGLFQINYWFEGWDNPWTNAQVAYEKKYLPALQRTGDGTSPWPVCRYY